jgi:hypothetical protein
MNFLNIFTSKGNVCTNEFLITYSKQLSHAVYLMHLLNMFMTVTEYLIHKDNVSANMSVILQATFIVK